MKKSSLAAIVLVALAVLLVLSVFFMLTTTRSQPVKMALVSPEHTEPDRPVKTDAVVNLVLFNADGVYGYRGSNIMAGKIYHTTDSSLRNWLLQMKKGTNEKDFLVMIKPSSKATYKNTVDVLDEMTINDIKQYKMMELSEPEQKITDSLSKG